MCDFPLSYLFLFSLNIKIVHIQNEVVCVLHCIYYSNAILTLRMLFIADQRISNINRKFPMEQPNYTRKHQFTTLIEHYDAKNLFGMKLLFSTMKKKQIEIMSH